MVASMKPLAVAYYLRNRVTLVNLCSLVSVFQTAQPFNVHVLIHDEQRYMK